MIPIEVVAAWPDHIVRVAIEIPNGSTLGEAVALARAESNELSKCLQRLEAQGGLTWGVFGREADAHTVLDAGARVELYRPLLRDPREARRVLASRGLNVTHGD